MRFALRSVLVLSVLYALVFVAADVFLLHNQAPLWFGLVFAVAVIGAQYLVAPYLIEWILPIRYCDDGLPAASHDFVMQLCRERDLPCPKLGLIESGTPNAFVFGRLQKDARLIVTRGLLDILSEEELNAVLAHEIGHIAHYDFLVMAVAALAPLLLWQVSNLTNHAGDHGRLISFGSYLAYWI